MWRRTEHIIESPEKFKDTPLGIWGSFSIDLCNLTLLFFLLFSVFEGLRTSGTGLSISTFLEASSQQFLSLTTA